MMKIIAADECYRNGEHVAKVTIELDVADFDKMEGLPIAEGLSAQVAHLAEVSKEARKRRAPPAPPVVEEDPPAPPEDPPAPPAPPDDEQ